MSEQNFRNHSRYLPIWHLLVPLMLLALLGGSINYFRIAPEGNKYPAALLILVSVIFVIYYWYTRAFALRAQDRAIRAEERLRHFQLTGQPLDPQLRMSQVIALRFASDAEFPALAKKAVSEKLSNRQIKQAINNWKADHNRV
jgi:hypothetical protein